MAAACTLGGSRVLFDAGSRPGWAVGGDAAEGGGGGGYGATARAAIRQALAAHFAQKDQRAGTPAASLEWLLNASPLRLEPHR